MEVAVRLLRFDFFFHQTSFGCGALMRCLLVVTYAADASYRLREPLEVDEGGERASLSNTAHSTEYVLLRSIQT